MSEYFVDGILGLKTSTKEEKYLIKWSNYSYTDDDRTWEDRDQIMTDLGINEDPTELQELHDFLEDVLVKYQLV